MKLIFTIPALNEEDWLFETIDSIMESDVNNKILICINNPDCWNEDEAKADVYANNRRTLEKLARLNNDNIVFFDKSSSGNGWLSAKHGVGHARNFLMEKACKLFDDEDIIVSMDADTKISKDYSDGVRAFFENHPEKSALSSCYYHRIEGLSPEDTRSMLRYEIYMRYYVINMLRIESPYAFTALGSALALRVSFYKKSGGVPKRNCTEDFYFLQRLAKYGKVYNYSEGMVYPSARQSDRVPFGTGSSVALGTEKIASSYPLFDYRSFDDIKNATDMFEKLYEKDFESPVFDFLSKQLNTDNLWQPLRDNNKSVSRFIHACHERLDGLRIFQYLRQESIKKNRSDEKNIIDFFKEFSGELVDDRFVDDIGEICEIEGLSFISCDIDVLKKIREVLFDIDMGLRKKSITN
ncbi:MAG: hypothetical protein PF692_03500 [Kiritimatiellae bacterium]|jgi:glycosyltransferase involved in cell wall biosynthesis|nr:hypothetical protein [Kiritimatiellia bacterium]